MKNKVAYLFLSLLTAGILFSSCEEEARGPLVNDGTPPGPVSDVTSTSIPGGARVQYKAPSDDDAILVEATYKRENGDVVVTKSSVFKDFLTIEGLRAQEPLDVSLVAVDAGDNKSTPVVVQVTPGKAPIDFLFESFEMVEDFGGVRLKYNNELHLTAEILFFVADEQGRMVYERSIFIDNDENDFHSFRGYENVPHTFGVIARDRWDHSTDMFTAELTPLFEVQLDSENFDDLAFPSDTPADWGTSVEGMWDGNRGVWWRGYHTNQGYNPPIVPPYTRAYQIFSIDLGVKAKLSRMKWWLRNGDCCNTPYGHGDPRFYEIWGTGEIPAGDPDGSSLDGWVKLVEDGEVVKPSGLPLGQHTDEDRAKGIAEGEENIFPLDAPPIRYIRFVTFENWAGSAFVHVTELEVFGQPEE